MVDHRVGYDHRPREILWKGKHHHPLHKCPKKWPKNIFLLRFVAWKIFSIIVIENRFKLVFIHSFLGKFLDPKRKGTRGWIGVSRTWNKGCLSNLRRDYLLCFLGAVSSFKLGLGESHYDMSSVKEFMEEGVRHTFISESQFLKSNDVFFHCTNFLSLLKLHKWCVSVSKSLLCLLCHLNEKNEDAYKPSWVS